MLKPVQITIDWQTPQPAVDALDPGKFPTFGGDWAGVYLHLIYGSHKQVVGSYIGKHQTSVAARQFEHLASYAAGDYNLLDASGQRAFSRGASLPANFTDLVVDHLSRMIVIFGHLVVTPQGHLPSWADASEALLQRSPSWISNGGSRLNFRQEQPSYQMFDRFELVHRGASEALAIFGNSTLWDRVQKTVI